MRTSSLADGGRNVGAGDPARGDAVAAPPAGDGAMAESVEVDGGRSEREAGRDGDLVEGGGGE